MSSKVKSDSSIDLSKYENDLLNFGETIDHHRAVVEDDKWFSEIDKMEVEYDDLTLNNEQKKENRGLNYSGLNHSLISWKKIDPLLWTDLGDWKRERALKDQHPKWMIALKTRNVVELMGRVLDCVGHCQSYRSNSYANIQFKSTIKEGDEVVTGKDSYLWIFLMDGTLVRLSPETSISFKEINISNQKIFFHARLNFGNLLWLSRIAETIKESNERETDSIFLPLSFYEANYFEDLSAPSEDDLYKYLVGNSNGVERQYKTLNKLIKDNNEFIKNRKTQVFLVMPNGSILGENLQFEAVVLKRGKSYFKNRHFSFYNPEATEISQRATFFYRGYINRDIFEVNLNQWYVVAEEGNNIMKHEDGDPNFSFGEYLTKRIPTIMLAREMLLAEYSKKLFNQTIDEQVLADLNYRLWDGKDKVIENEMEKRVDFLKEYTRREETTTLRVAKRFDELLVERGRPVDATPYNESFYQSAVNHFILMGNKRAYKSEDTEILNSTKKKFWELIHFRRNGIN